MRRYGRIFRPEGSRYTPEHAGLLLAGLAEVRIHPVGFQPARPQKSEHFADVLRRKPQAVHSRIELDVERRTRGRRHIRKRAERFAVRDGCGQTACGGSCKFLGGTHRGEHGKSPPVGAERRSFADRSHPEKVRIRFGCARNFAHAVPVSVRFHHEKHAHARACAHRLQIAAYSAQIDFRVQVHFPSDCNILCRAERKSTPRTAETISAVPPLLQRRRS